MDEAPPTSPGELKDEMMETLAELTSEIKIMYDRLSKAHELAWNTLRPILGNVQVARSIVEAGLTPPVVHMVTDVGCHTLRRFHDPQGGQNRSDRRGPLGIAHQQREQAGGEDQNQRAFRMGWVIFQNKARATRQRQPTVAAAGSRAPSRVLVPWRLADEALRDQDAKPKGQSQRSSQEARKGQEEGV